ncbi:MAG: 2-dehydro-3-deoxy-6-phosphogalactonate aldolase [Parvibaculales bacterium]
MDKIEKSLSEMPIISVLRGIKPEEAVDVGRALLDAGIGIMEVTMNSPSPLESIRLLKEHYGDEAVIGAGTVMNAEQVDQIADLGGEIIVTPNINAAVIKRALDRGLAMFPGFLTPSEASAACDLGARHLKLFPAGVYGLDYIKAIQAVLPKDVRIYAVGGVGSHNAKQWFDAGVNGLGIGTEIYRAGLDAKTVGSNAKAVAEVIRAL